MSVRLYVGNLPKEPIERDDLQAIFADEGDSVSVKVIKDRKTGKCRGFGFVTVPTDEKADELIEKYNGQPFQQNPLKIEKALPRSKEKPEEDSESRSEEAPTEGEKNTKRRKSNKKQRRGSEKAPDTGNVQPDPRWADELAKLKEMLNAHKTN